MNLSWINRTLLSIMEQMDDIDHNDLDEFGMDMRTRKRLGIKSALMKGKVDSGKHKKPERKMPSTMPSSLKNITHTLAKKKKKK